jgi:hypothetical protein
MVPVFNNSFTKVHLIDTAYCIENEIVTVLTIINICAVYGFESEMTDEPKSVLVCGK